MTLTHDTLLFKTTVFESASDFTNYGVHVRNGEFELAYVQRFYKKSSTSKTWLCDEIYSSATMRVMPDIFVPPDVWASAKWWFMGMLTRSFNS